MKFWPPHCDVALEHSDCQWIRALDTEAFDVEIDLPEVGTATAAAGAALRAAASLVRPAVSRQFEASLQSSRVPPADTRDLYLHGLDLSTLGPGARICLWRAGDGWILVFAGEPTAWRTFCATFLNRTLATTVPAETAWAEVAVNSLATQVLDTYRADDAVGACLTYGVGAAVVEGWRDSESPWVGKALSERLAWAVLEETNACNQGAFEEGSEHE